MKREDRSQLLDRATEAVRAHEPDSAAVEAAAHRVWERLASPAVAATPVASLTGPIEGCAGYQALLPLHLAGQLPPARALLVQEHLRECVPCRRALRNLQAGAPASTSVAFEPAPRRLAPVWRWAAAAALVAGLGVASWAIVQSLPAKGQEATIAMVDGTLLQVGGSIALPMEPGDSLSYGETVRTAKGTRAVVRLHDGTRIEMRERSELAVRERRGETAIELVRGAVIVEAAKQRGKHLYVDTDAARVAVTGTVFSVHHGTKGSRVSVVEGEVHVDQRDGKHILHGGDQVTSSPRLERLSLEKELAWSANAANYLAVLAELRQVGDEIADAVPAPGQRHATTLLDQVPATTAVYIAVPNVAEDLDRAYALFSEKVAASAVLAPWWAEQTSEGDVEDHLKETLASVRELGGYLGDEVVVALIVDEAGDVSAPVALATLRRSPAELRAFVEQQVAAHPDARVVFVDDPATLPVAPPAAPEDGEVATTGDDALYIWTTADRVAVSPEPSALRAVAAGPALGNGFHDRLAAAYADGVTWLLAADLGRLVATATAGDEPADPTLAATGFGDVEYLLLESKEEGGRTTAQAAVSFRGERTGIASWLAPPSPMGALDFVSSDAALVSAFAVKAPRAMVDDLVAMMAADGEAGQDLTELETRLGLSVRDDIAGPLGGEMVIALDGPVVPTPAWKVIIEVYDPAHLQATLEQLAVELDRTAREHGDPGFELLSESSGDLEFHTLRRRDGAYEAHYVIAEGYFVAAPQKALLQRAIDYKRSGSNLRNAAKFTALLPTDGQVDLSAFVYHDLGQVLEPLSKAIAGAPTALTQEQRETFARIGAQTTPTLAWAYAEPERIRFATSGSKGLLGLDLGSFLGFGTAASLADIAELAHHGGESQGNVQ